MREKIEKKFEQFGLQVIRFKWGIILVITILTVFMAFQFNKIKIDTSTEGFLREDDPTIADYNEFRNLFGRDERIVIMIHPKNVFDLEFIKKLRIFHQAIENRVPYIDTIDSLINARSTRGEEDLLIVEELMESFGNSEEELPKIKQRILDNPLYRNLLISEDGEYTSLIVKTNAYSSKKIVETEEFDLESLDIDQPGFDDQPRKPLTNEENSLLVKTIQEVIAEYNNEQFPIYLGGSPVVTDSLKEAMMNNMMLFTRLAIVTIFISLFILFRRWAAVFLPLLVVILSVVFTIGYMILHGTSLKLPTMLLPSLLLAITVGSTVHLMTIFFIYYNGKNKNEAIIQALGHSGLPITMTSLTTAAGLASFSAAEVAPIGDLGRFAAASVLTSLLFTILLLPSLLAIVRVKPHTKKRAENEFSILERFLLMLGNFAHDYPKSILLTSAFVTAISFIGISKLNFSHDMMRWHQKDSEIRKNAELIDKEMRGSLSVEMIINTGVENGFHQPEMMNNLERLANKISILGEDVQKQFVGKTVSLADILKEINQALQKNKAEHYRIPQAQDVIAQEFLLFENSGSDDLEEIVDNKFSITHLTVKLPWQDSRVYVNFVEAIKSSAESLFGESVEIKTTGLIVLYMQMAYAMMNSAVESYLIAGIVITLLMMIMLANFKIGLISMIPNLTPIILTLGIMGWFGIAMDMFTVLIGSIAIGLVVDDTIHYFHNFQKYFQINRNIKQAIEQTVLTTGKAMVVTSLVLTMGFFIFMAASLNNVILFGFLIGITLIFAFFADMIIAPAILTLISKKSSIKMNISNDISN